MTRNDINIKSSQPLVLAKDIVRTSLTYLKNYANSIGQITGLSTGFYDLDALTNGFHPSQLIIIGSRPSMGKSAFAMNIVVNVVVDQKVPVVYFTLDMSKEILIRRLITTVAAVDHVHFRTSSLQDTHWQSINQAANELEKAPLYIDDYPYFDLSEIRKQCLKLKSSVDTLGLIVIDDVQRLSGSRNCEQTFAISAELCRELKELAIDLEVPVVALSQLPRSLESRKNKRPNLADLGNCAETDLVMFVYREEYYNPASKQRGDAEIIVARNKSGPFGYVDLSYQSGCSRFSDRPLSQYVVDTLAE